MSGKPPDPKQFTAYLSPEEMSNENVEADIFNLMGPQFRQKKNAARFRQVESRVPLYYDHTQISVGRLNLWSDQLISNKCDQVSELAHVHVRPREAQDKSCRRGTSC